jgi:hypothetical protein
MLLGKIASFDSLYEAINESVHRGRKPESPGMKAATPQNFLGFQPYPSSAAVIRSRIQIEAYAGILFDLGQNVAPRRNLMIDSIDDAKPATNRKRIYQPRQAHKIRSTYHEVDIRIDLHWECLVPAQNTIALAFCFQQMQESPHNLFACVAHMQSRHHRALGRYWIGRVGH